MPRIAVLTFLLLTAAVASAERRITSISPNVGFTTSSTRVIVRGSELASEFMHCVDRCSGTFPCPVTVTFGSAQAVVQYALPEYIVLHVPGRPAGPADVTVRVAGKDDLVVPNGFRFDARAVTSLADYVPYLVPVIANDVAGAHGSKWRSELTVHNASLSSDEPVVIRGAFCDPMLPIAQCPDVVIESGATESLVVHPAGWGSQAAFVYVPRARSGSTPFELRVRDLSRESEGWGTEIPVVRINDFSPFQQILDVPTDGRYRATLRIYRTSHAPLPVKVRVLPPQGDEPIDEWRITLNGIPTFDPAEFELHPAYAQLDPLTSAVRASGYSTVRVEVSNDDDSIADPPASIWAFISITNNETQQVTAITPH